MYINGVFEGGGIKGLSYIGVLSFLEERGIRFNKLAGVSIGALFSALVKCGYNSKELKEIIDSIDMKNFLVNDKKNIGKVFHSFKNKGLYSIDKLEDFIHELLLNKGYKNFIDLKMGDDYLLKVIVTDLKRKRMLVFPNDLKLYNINPDSFPISKAVAMSCNLPLLFQPYKLKGDYFLDGGVSNNFPIDIYANEKVKTIGFCLGKNQVAKSNGIVKKIQNYTFNIDGIKNTENFKIVEIETYNIKATDFREGFSNKEKLYNAGYTEMRNFFYTGMLRNR